MRDETFVSIITPCYNAEKYIAETIKSVRNQTYQNWEMLICDDCSTDNSAEIIKEFCTKDNRIKYLKTDYNTGGPSMPRNIAINNSVGDYIAFLDADDVWLPTKLAVQLDLVHSKKVGIVYSNGKMIDAYGKIVRDLIFLSSSNYFSNLKQCQLTSSSTLLRRDIVLGHVFKNVQREDFVFWLDILKKDNQIAYNTNTVEFYYRIVPNSRSRNKLMIVWQQWYTLRKDIGLNVLVALYYFMNYIFRIGMRCLRLRGRRRRCGSGLKRKGWNVSCRCRRWCGNGRIARRGW